MGTSNKSSIDIFNNLQLQFFFLNFRPLLGRYMYNNVFIKTAEHMKPSLGDQLAQVPEVPLQCILELEHASYMTKDGGGARQPFCRYKENNCANCSFRAGQPRI